MATKAKAKEKGKWIPPWMKEKEDMKKKEAPKKKVAPKAKKKK